MEREQQKAAGAGEELLTLTERLGEAERQLHLTRYPDLVPHPLTPSPLWPPFQPTGGCHRLSDSCWSSSQAFRSHTALRHRSKTRRHVSDECGRELLICPKRCSNI